MTMDLPSRAQLDYAGALLRKLGYDETDYPLETMTRQEVLELNSKLKDEWELQGLLPA